MKTLTSRDYALMAGKLDIETAILKAVCEVEAPRGGFFGDGSPTILFERHKFHQFTNGIYTKSHPDISNPRPGGYKGGTAEHDRLKRAVELNRTAALKSASWGKFQIMGFNYKLAGFKTLQRFINAMFRDEKSQLEAFAKFVHNVGLVDELQRKDWRGFARGYNGRYYYKNNYHAKLENAYKRIKYEK